MELFSKEMQMEAEEAAMYEAHLMEEEMIKIALEEAEEEAAMAEYICISEEDITFEEIDIQEEDEAKV
ncbi:hypothetical protein LJC72_05825 [Bacteroides sp. OttesenSCG-928-D19]|nr:hypothetical protein [Bacteroides sp. OttesenSCG-928-D19]